MDDLVPCADCDYSLIPVPQKEPLPATDRWTASQQGPAERAAYRCLGALRYALPPDVWRDVDQHIRAAFEELRR